MDFETLIQNYLDGELTPRQHTKLSDWLEQDEANREAFVSAVNLDTDLNRYLANEQLHAFLQEVDIHALHHVMQQPHTRQSEALLSADTTPPSQSPNLTFRNTVTVLSLTGSDLARHLFRKHGIGIGIAAVFAIAAVLSVVMLTSGPSEPDSSAYTQDPAPRIALAYVSQTHQAKWSGPAFDRRDAIPQGSYALTQGSVELDMESGAKVLIQAPARFTLKGSNQIEMQAGTLDAQVPRRAIGFTVQTPDARIVDIGTEFNVVVDEKDRQTKVAVHTGKVLASASGSLDNAEPISITAGQAVAVGSDAQLRTSAYEPGSFAKASRANRYKPVAMNGDIEFYTDTPKDMRRGSRTSDKLQVYLEQTDLLLEEDIEVNMLGSDLWPDAMKQKPRVFKAGQRVDVYLLHMDKTGIDTEDVLHTLDFGRPILGIVATQHYLSLTDHLAKTGVRWFDNSPDSEGLLLRGIEKQDTLNLMPGGTAMQIQMLVDHRTDQVRVLVQSQAEN